MKNIKLVLGLVLVTGLMSCSRSLVRSDYDSEINFARLNTFDWKSESEYSGSNGLAKNSLLEKRLKKAVEAELVAKNLSKQANSPAFLITYSVAVDDKVDVRSDGFGYGYGNGYGYGLWHGYSRFSHWSRFYGFGYGSGFYNNGGVYSYQYKEVTLILDFIDPASNELLWRGVYIDEIGDSGIISEEKINEAVKHILQKFPPEDSSVGTTNLLTSNEKLTPNEVASNSREES